MSNEMQDWLTDNKANAQWWVERYPFLRIKDNRVYPWLNTEEVEECWLDCLPDGWVKAFGKQMCDDLMETLGDYASEWKIAQVKEKFGAMRLYHNGCPKDIASNVESIIGKYSYISQFVCVNCGSLDAQMYNDGWVSPWCDKCFTHMMEYKCEKYDLEKTNWDKFIVGNKFIPTYEIKRFTEAGITTVTVDVSDEWERLKTH